MPVLITGAEEPLGTAIAQRLLTTGGEVRVWLDAELSGDDDARAWRARGAKAALGTFDDEGRMEAAFEQVHTVVHTGGGPLEPPDRGTEAVATLVSAVLGAGCRRVVWVTDVALAAADRLGSSNPHVQALAERAELLGDLPLDVVTLRTGLRYGPGDALTGMLAGAVGTVPAAVPHSPVWLGDVAAAVAAADAQRGSRSDVHLAVDLVGPDVLPLGRIAEGLASVPGVEAHRAELSGRVRAWLEVPGTGGEEALGRDGVPFAEGIRLLTESTGGAGDAGNG